MDPHRPDIDLHQSYITANRRGPRRPAAGLSGVGSDLSNERADKPVNVYDHHSMMYHNSISVSGISNFFMFSNPYELYLPVIFSQKKRNDYEWYLPASSSQKRLLQHHNFIARRRREKMGLYVYGM